MAVGVRVASARSDVCGIQDVDVDEVDLGADAGVEVLVALLDVLAPEVGALEEFCAFGDFAAELAGVFLSDELADR